MAIIPKIEAFEKACRNADNEKDDVRNTQELMRMLSNLSQFDARIRGLILTRKTAITSFSWNINALDNENEQDVLNAQSAQRRLKKAIDSILSRHTDTAIFGIGGFSLDWQNPNGNEWLCNAIALPVQKIERLSDNRLCIVTNDNKKQIIDDTDDSYALSHDNNTIRGGILRSIAPLLIIKSENWVEWLNYNRKLKGIIVAQYDEQKTFEDDKRVATEMLKNVTDNNAGLLSNLVDFKFFDAVSNIGATSFKELIENINSDASIAILGQANTTQLPSSGGSRAALQVLKMISSDIHFDDMNRIESFINEKLIQPDYNRSFDANSTTKHLFRINVPEEQDALTRVNVIATALNARIPLNAIEIYQSIGFTKPESVDDVLGIDDLSL